MTKNIFHPWQSRRSFVPTGCRFSGPCHARAWEVREVKFCLKNAGSCFFFCENPSTRTTFPMHDTRFSCKRRPAERLVLGASERAHFGQKGDSIFIGKGFMKKRLSRKTAPCRFLGSPWFSKGHQLVFKRKPKGKARVEIGFQKAAKREKLVLKHTHMGVSFFWAPPKIGSVAFGSFKNQPRDPKKDASIYVRALNLRCESFKMWAWRDPITCFYHQDEGMLARSEPMRIHRGPFFAGKKASAKW